MNPRFVAQRHMYSIIKSMLERRIELDTFSSVTSLPGSTDQNWHADTNDLFYRTKQAVE